MIALVAAVAAALGAMSIQAVVSPHASTGPSQLNVSKTVDHAQNSSAAVTPKVMTACVTLEKSNAANCARMGTAGRPGGAAMESCSQCPAQMDCSSCPLSSCPFGDCQNAKLQGHNEAKR